MVQGLDDEGIWLAMPMVGRHAVNPRDGQQVVVSYSDDRGRYTFTAQVVTSRQGRLPLIHVGWPDEIVRRQERKAFRLDVKIRALLRPHQDHGWETFQSRDLSAGGVLVAGSLPPDWGDQLEVKVVLPEAPVRMLGRVVRTTGDATAIEFLGMDLKDVDAIMAFLFDEQRKRRNLGLI